MHLPGSHRAHTLIGGKTVCPARAQTTKAGATQFAVADIRRQVEAFSAVAPAYVEEEHCT